MNWKFWKKSRKQLAEYQREELKARCRKIQSAFHSASLPIKGKTISKERQVSLKHNFFLMEIAKLQLQMEDLVNDLETLKKYT